MLAAAWATLAFSISRSFLASSILALPTAALAWASAIRLFLTESSRERRAMWASFFSTFIFLMAANLRLIAVLRAASATALRAAMCFILSSAVSLCFLASARVATILALLASSALWRLR